MARPRTPTDVLELKGAFRKNPKRGEARAHEPRAGVELRPPADFLRTDLSIYAEYLAIWEEVTGICWWLTAAEAGPLESYCRLKRKERHGLAKPADLTNLFKLYPVLGMTQDGRARFGPRGEGGESGDGRPPRSEGDDWEGIRAEAQRLRVV